MRAKAKSRSVASSCCPTKSAALLSGAAPVPLELLPAAECLFGVQLGNASRYAEMLVGDGVLRGLLGPREGVRIWERHLLNSAAVADLIPAGARVIDVGSGAGLPGIPVALAAPASRVVLLEPLARRCAFLQEVIEELDLGDRVVVVVGRAPNAVRNLPFLADCVLARAVAPLERLVSWTMPLVRPGGELLALRGQRAEQEMQEVGFGLSQYGAGVARVVELAADLLGTPVRVLRVPRVARLRKDETRVRSRRGS